MNVIWIVSDTLRRMEVGAYGNRKIHTPAMDALAAKSTRFDRAYIASFPTMPTRADHMTGRFTVSFMKWEALPRGEVTLPQILNRARINTAAMVDTPFYLRNGMNYDRGFSTFEEIPGQLWRARGSDPRFRNEYTGRRLDTDCFAAQTFSRAMQWLELNYTSDFFLYIDTWDPHEPWNAPDYYTELYWPGYDGEQIRSLYGYWPKSPDFTEEKVKKAYATYCGEVTMVDTWLGYLLRKVENMGLMEDTAIIFTSDHGYYFGEHGGMYGKMIFSSNPDPGTGGAGIWARSPYYEEVTSIPLLIYYPGIPAREYKGLTSAIDLMPTVLDMFGVDIPPGVEGRSVLPAIRDTNKPGREHLFSSSVIVNAGDTDQSVDGVRRNAETASMATVTTDEWTLLYDTAEGGSELYNLQDDPGQEHDVIDHNRDVAKELHGLLLKHLRETNVEDRLIEPRKELRL